MKTVKLPTLHGIGGGLHIPIVKAIPFAFLTALFPIAIRLVAALSISAVS
jgi:hypothetical protein